MFRRILLRALQVALSLWAAILISTLLFGLICVLNVLVTGEVEARPRSRRLRPS